MTTDTIHSAPYSVFDGEISFTSSVVPRPACPLSSFPWFFMNVSLTTPLSSAGVVISSQHVWLGHLSARWALLGVGWWLSGCFPAVARSEATWCPFLCCLFPPPWMEVFKPLSLNSERLQSPAWMSVFCSFLSWRWTLSGPLNLESHVLQFWKNFTHTHFSGEYLLFLFFLECLLVECWISCNEFLFSFCSSFCLHPTMWEP